MSRLDKTVKASVMLFVFFLSISGAECMMTLKNAAGTTGGSVTIPCYYDKKYSTNPKFWCKGYTWNYCTIVAYANHTGHTTITDLPAQNVFVVEMDRLKDSDSGWYWCAAEISGIIPDDRDYLYLTVSRDPAVYVLESRVLGEEGGSVTIQCLYSAAYKNEQKQWCRFKDRRCYRLGTTERSQDSAVHVKADGKGSLSVQMTGLKKSDAGWYSCSAEDLEVPVHLSIGHEHPGLPEEQFRDSSSDFTTRILIIISAILLLLMVFGLVIWKLKQKQSGAAVMSERRTDTLHPASEEEMTYISVISSHNPASSTIPHDKVIYSSVKPHH